MNKWMHNEVLQYPWQIKNIKNKKIEPTIKMTILIIVVNVTIMTKATKTIMKMII